MPEAALYQAALCQTPRTGLGVRIKAGASLAATGSKHVTVVVAARTWKDGDPVLASGVGTSRRARNLHREFKSHLKRAGLPETTRLHDLRHTFATLLLRHGVDPKFVQELLEHRDTALTLNVCAHALPDMGDAAAGAMEDVLG